MKMIGYIFAALMFAFGFLFVLSAFSAQSTNSGGQLTTGIILFAMGSGIIWLLKKQKIVVQEPKETIIKQEINLTGDLKLDQLKCNACGGALTKENVTVNAGAVMISCPYCGSQYQITEEVKW
jgi:hypothetical protein